MCYHLLSVICYLYSADKVSGNDSDLTAQKSQNSQSTQSLHCRCRLAPLPSGRLGAPLVLVGLGGDAAVLAAVPEEIPQ